MHRVQNEVKFSSGNGNEHAQQAQISRFRRTFAGLNSPALQSLSADSPPPAAWLGIEHKSRHFSMHHTCATCVPTWLLAQTAPPSEKGAERSEPNRQAQSKQMTLPEHPQHPLTRTQHAKQRAVDRGARSAGTLLGSIRPAAPNDQVDGHLVARVVEALVLKQPGEHVRSKALSGAYFCGSRGMGSAPRALKVKFATFPDQVKNEVVPAAHIRTITCGKERAGGGHAAQHDWGYSPLAGHSEILHLCTGIANSRNSPSWLSGTWERWVAGDRLHEYPAAGGP